MAIGSAYVGRDAEQGMLSAALEASSVGSPAAIVIAGEAGAGKTRLVREVAEAAVGAGHIVLWGSCLRFAAETSPFLPIGRLLTQWHRQATTAERARVLAGAEPLATIAPALGTTDRDMQAGQLIPLAAAVLERIVAGTPTVLVVDDLQWADSASLDLLGYLLAGFTTGERLTVLTTYRDTDLGEGHRLHGWLADILRLPAVSSLRLERLGLAETQELVADLIGRPGSHDQVGAEIFARSAGNPYLTELLVRHAAGAQAPGDDLDQVLLASWHRLSVASREVLQLLAVGGRPVDVTVLERLVEVRGSTDVVVRSALAEAAGEGLVVRDGGRVWFHHPLLAEVVATTFEPADLVDVHRAYVSVLEADTELAAASRAAHLALHHHGARHLDEAFTWSLRAADEASRVRAFGEEAGHLHRACDLWDAVSEAARDFAGERLDLLERASVIARSAGEYMLAVRLREQAIALVDSESDPRRAVSLRLPLQQLEEMSGLAPGLDVGASESILELAQRCPGTAEHAIALGSLSVAEFWSGRPEAAAEHAREATRLAIDLQSDEALAIALGIRAQIEPEVHQAVADAERAVRLAESTGDRLLLGNAGADRALVFMSAGRLTDVADSVLEVYRRIVDTGSVHDAVFAGPAIAVLALADLGRVAEARALLRDLLSRRLANDAALDARACAAVLALRSGDAASAQDHLSRVRELMPAERLAGRFVNRVEVQALCLAKDPDRAVGLVGELMRATADIGARTADELLFWATRSCADLADAPGRRPEAVGRLDEIDRMRGDGTRFAMSGPDDLVHRAKGRVLAAERARCHGDVADLPALWQDAAAACDDAGLVWEEALARYRLAQAVLTGRGPRDLAASSLRSAWRIATEIGAQPILDDVGGLARQARIPLDEPPSPDTVVPASPESVWATLTSREREVLAHLVSGRTYAEIAGSLFISEKTVSVHVSNILRKTGTSNRIEVAELARAAGDDALTGPPDGGTGQL